MAARSAEHALGFVAARPFRHVVLDNFLEPAFCQKLLEDFPSFEDRFALNEMGQVGGKAVRMDMREVSPAFLELDRQLQAPEFLGWLSHVTGIPDLLYDPDYVGGGTHENRDGQGLDAHVDFNYHPRSRTHRRLNLIVYLNHEWDDAWGGSLELHSNPWDPTANQTQRVLPLFNRAVIFETTETSWHGFSRISLPAERKALSRKSIAVYFYTKERPLAETAPSHATIYVPEPLPQGLDEGSVLAAADIAELRARFTRMRTQLRYLYEREKHFAAQFAAMDGALAEARGAVRLPLQGHATQDEAPQGMWPDRWVGVEFAGRFVPRRKLTAIEIDLWVSDQIDDAQMLDVEVNGIRSQHRVARGRRAQVNLKVSAAASSEVVLRIHAARQFVPAQSGQSGDDRALAWRLLDVTLTQ
jgi:Rps23 Pro-64 3,4-dihydroxylase Tpa1-like proline 4-hydroxylase